ILVAIFALLPFAEHVYWVSPHDAHSVFLQLPKFGNPQDVKRFFENPFFQDPRLIVVGLMSLLFALIALARFGLVFPIIVAEGRLSFWRSWVVTRGNFLRLVGFWIVVVALTYVLSLVMIAITAFAVIAMISGLMGGQTVGAFSVLIFAVPAAVSFGVYLV